MRTVASVGARLRSWSITLFIDGLLPIGRLGGGKRIRHPQDVLQVGQQLLVVIEGIDRAQRRKVAGDELAIEQSVSRPPHQRDQPCERIESITL